MKYANRNHRTLEPHFSQHMLAMTAEDLYDKADIAAELAFRDSLIAQMSDFLKLWSADGHLQTFADRERFRAAAGDLLITTEPTDAKLCAS